MQLRNGNKLVEIGSELHKELFCKSFLESYQEYNPQLLPWPQLDNDALTLLRGIPFWQEALTVEVRAGAMVTAFAETVTDPLIQSVIALQGQEESRHARLLEAMMQHYDIKVAAPTPKMPKHLSTGFIDLGHEECLDSFFAFGLFELARQAQVFPEAMFTIFESILDEEARHIVFFANWMTYMQIHHGQKIKFLRAPQSLWYYGRALNRLIGSIGKGTVDGPGFTVSGASAFPLELTPELFLATCIRENERRMQKFDARLLHPQLMPAIANVALNTLKLWPRKKSVPLETANLS